MRPLRWPLLYGLLALLMFSCRSSIRPLSPYQQAAPRTTRATRPAPPARPPALPPVSLTTDDGTRLRLATLNARAVVEDPLALTELEFVFENDVDRTIEGRFELLLPQGSQVTRFATFADGQWKEAEIVEKQYARQAYEAMVHEDRDPALLERDTGNRFRGRVYPIQPYGRTRVLISYAQTLPDPEQPYRLALQDLPPLETFDARVVVAAPAGSGRPPKIVQRRFEDQRPREIVIPRPAEPASGLRNGQRVVARVEPLGGIDPGELRPLHHLTVLFDTSASRALEHEQSVDRLERLLHALSRHAGTAQLDLYAFDQQVVPIYRGSLARMGRAPFVQLRQRRPLGASDLEAALDTIATRDRDRVLLVTDGLISAGADSNSQLRRSLSALAEAGIQRLDVLPVGKIRDDARLRRLTTGPLPEGGVLLDAEDAPDRLAQRMALPTMDGLRLDLPGAKWWHPRTLEGLQPGDHVTVYAELRGEPSESVEIQVSGPVHTVHTVTLHETETPLLDHTWMAGRVELLIERIAALRDRFKSEQLRRLAVSLSVRHRIFNDLTAMLVLETDADYQRFGIDRRALSDILVVRRQGVELEQRSLLDPSELDVGLGNVDNLGNESDEVPDEPTGTGHITGQIRDRDTDRPIGYATVALHCDCLPAPQEIAADRHGRYGFSGLPAGTFQVHVYAEVANQSRIVSLPEGARLVANFEMVNAEEYSTLIHTELEESKSRGRMRQRLRRRRSNWKTANESPDGRGSNARGARQTATSDRFEIKGRVAKPEPAPYEVVEQEPPAAQQQTSVGRTVSMEEFRNIPVGSSTSRDYTQVVETSATASADSAGISLAGTTGAESKYTVEGANVNNPSFGTIGMAGSYGPSFEADPARVELRQFVVRGRGLSRWRARMNTRDHREQIEGCYFSTLERDPGIRGRVRVELRLDEQGTVTAVNAVRRLGVRDASLLDCVDRALRGITFPVENDHTPRVLATLVFAAGSGPPSYPWEEPEPAPAPEPSPLPIPTNLPEIESALAAGRVRQASAMAWRWRTTDPASPLALVAVGLVAEASGDTTLAARAYGSLLDLFPTRADMLRHAASRLERLGQPDPLDPPDRPDPPDQPDLPDPRAAGALDLAVDAYRRARAQRPDHPSSHRHLAFALLRQDRPQDAFEAIERGLAQDYPPDRFNGVQRVLREDLGIIAAVWLHVRPAEARSIKARLKDQGATLAAEPSRRFVLSWETDANDVDLHVVDSDGNDAYHEQPTLPAGGQLYADVDNGYGPECFAAHGPAAQLPYRVMVHYFDQGPMGFGLGKVMVVDHDGGGRVVIESRPFAITEDGGIADLGVVSPIRSFTDSDAGNDPHSPQATEASTFALRR